MQLTCRRSSLYDLNVVSFTEDLAVLQGELLSRRQLSLTALTGEAGQMVDILLGSPDPVCTLDTP